LWIVNCNNFETVKCTHSGDQSNISRLVEIHIENCPGLKTVDIQGQNNPDLSVYLLGCDGLENLNISNTTLTGNKLILPAKGFSSLRSLNLSKTTFSYLKFGNTDI
jgi:hypothetical protein